ncbi:unnamed protein product [Urochloa decumbens]|uniref:Leucine-rich repeat-containing N-terminal plant-type domain-containing protein n=1 Tax=Urochloa decumbens TaxID=240449 RepID=A0ABC9A557_9POAL
MSVTRHPLLCSSSKSMSTNKFPLPVYGIALVLMLCFASPSINCCLLHEKTTLIKFLNGLSAQGGLNMSWRNDTNCCKWEGITCSMDGMVTDVLLASRSLEGTISPCLGNLTRLMRLNLSSNLLFGSLPQELVSSSSIIVLDISFNRLTGGLKELPYTAHTRPLQVLNISSNLFRGSFPSTTWETMKNLVVLNASNNSFTGQLPTQFCTSSPSLAVLELCYNQFSEKIPPGLGSCSMLRVLKVGHNNLTGALPDELFNATSLEFLSFPWNGLQGTLQSAHIVKLSNLTTLDLGGNSFSGIIPKSIGHLKRLEELHLNNNMMYGELPPTLINCTNLMTINLQTNNFSGELTKVNFSNLPNLKIMDLMSNSFSGTIPKGIYSCRNLTALRLSFNKFHGQLPDGIGNLKLLTFLSLGNNGLKNITNALQMLGSSKNLITLLIGKNFRHETMPQDGSLGGFENIQILSLDGCALYGKIPHWLAKLTNLGVLMLHDNRLTGPIPDWISSLNFLFYLQLSNNNLTGEIPKALMQMPMLRSEAANHLDPRSFLLPIYSGPSLQLSVAGAFRKELVLSVNKLDGEIPPGIGQLKTIWGLNFSSNLLSGVIPQSICNLTSLQLLDLSSNHLTGTIPSALNNLHFLSKFNISNNELQGPVPTGGQFNTFQSSSFSGNPKLCGRVLNCQCNSIETAPLSIISAKEWGTEVIFSIAFGLFIGVGLLYDQLVLYRFFG